MELDDISVHLIADERCNQVWLGECLESLHSQGVQVVHSTPVNGDLTQARFNAFARQSTPWVSWIDPDDLSIPGSYEALAAAIRPGVTAVTGDEIYLRSDGTKCGTGPKYGLPIDWVDIRRGPLFAHKGIVHRECLDIARRLIADDKTGIDWALMLAATLLGDVVKVLRPIHKWRFHNLQMHKTAQTDYAGILGRYDALRLKLKDT